MKQKLMLLLAMLAFGASVAVAQTRQIAGLVIDGEEKLPLQGALISVKGTTISTFSGSDGHFVFLRVPTSAKTLVVSALGYKSKEIAVADVVQVTLDPSESALDEAMVVAYGTTTRNTFTGSASVVKSDEIGKLQVSNPVEALNGRVAGVQFRNTGNQPGASSPGILIRGITSISASPTPLIVLDGTPFDGDMNLINAQDIESMTVLKDAASTALYGARAANGVILIQTKRGKNSDGHTTVTVDAKWGSNSKAIPDYNYITSPAAYYELYYAGLRGLALNSGMNEARAHAWAVGNIINNNTYGLQYNVYTVPEGQTLIGFNGKLNPNATLGRVVSAGGQDYQLYPDNWSKAIYGHGLRQEYTVTASAHNGEGSYYASVNYLNNEGITIGSEFERITSRLKADYQLKPWLRLSANMMYAHYRQQYLDNDGEDSYSGNMFSYTLMAPIYPVFLRDAQGNTIWDPTSKSTLYDYGDGTVGTRPYLSKANPLSQVQLDRNELNGNTFRAEGVAEITFLKDFKFTSRNTAFVVETRAGSTTNPYFGQYASSNGSAAVEHDRRFTTNFQQLLNWAHVYGKHSIAAMAGHEYNKSRDYILYGQRHNQWNPDDYELASAVIVDGTSSSRGTYNSERWLGRAEYNYAERYFLAAAISREASSNFHPDHRWGTFYALSAAWRISQEKWFNVKWVDDLKLKASYGENGNDRIASFAYTTYYSPQNADGTASLVPAQKGNEKVTWETVGNFNVGLDFSLFKGVLSGSVEYFNRKTTDMLYFFPLPPSFGWSGYYTNIGDMRNRGIEFELVANIIRQKDFNWSVNFNLTHYKNKVLRLDESQKTLTVDGHPGYESGSFFIGEGLSLYTFYLKKYAGVNELGQSMWYKKADNGALETTTEFNDADFYLCGTALPKVYGGFGTSLEWKGIDFSVDFAYQLGGKVYDGDYQASMGINRGRMMHADLLKGVMLDAFQYDANGNLLNPYTGSIPRVFYQSTPTQNGSSDRWLTSASYLALQNITLGYTLPDALTRKLGISKLRIYGTADNVWLWSKRQGLDPRQQTANSRFGDASNQYYAPIRTISGGVTVTF